MPPLDAQAQLEFLVFCIRHSNGGKVDFGEVAKECDISKAAAAKRYERLLKSHGIDPKSMSSIKKEGGGGGAKDSSSTASASGTKKEAASKGRKKRKLDKTTHADVGDIDEPPPSSSVKGEVKSENLVKSELLPPPAAVTVKEEDLSLLPPPSDPPVKRSGSIKLEPGYPPALTPSPPPPLPEADDDDEVMLIEPPRASTAASRRPTAPSPRTECAAHAAAPAPRGPSPYASAAIASGFLPYEYAANWTVPHQMMAATAKTRAMMPDSSSSPPRPSAAGATCYGSVVDTNPVWSTPRAFDSAQVGGYWRGMGFEPRG